ncbi:CASP-like protein 3A1 [Punica granatum]|uniref:CASP-like protein n=1 Tax=Punica granatum TaxID=22663 RepID=A0A218X009_PUNGR|nr:CASP-like protein 3A1 [Punica granatum]OWM78116.1 hypothetical protein CDL15_Pgr014935 [Punica granatum]
MSTGLNMLAPEPAALPPETKLPAVEEEHGGITGINKMARRNCSVSRRKAELVQVALRLSCTATSLTAMAFMVTAEQASVASIYGFSFPIRSKWSFSDSFMYLVGVSAAVGAYSLVQLLISVSRLLKRSPLIPSRRYAWLIFAGDQVFAYALMSAGSASSGVTNLNRTGIRHTALPNFCNPLRSFCNHVAVSIAFTFFGCILLATSAVLDVIWLTKN